MVPRFLPLVLALLVVCILLAGCGERAAPRPAETPGATPVPATTAAETSPVTEATTVPVTTAPPATSPAALSVGTPYTYGRGDISMEVTVYKVKVMDGYEWWSPQWGKYWNTTPKAGNHFLFALVRFIDRGTARARLPSQSMFVLRGEDGSTYIQTSDRDHSLWIKDIDVKQYDFYFDNTAGWIDPGESNGVEGFFLYEVPAGLTPDHASLDATFSSKANASWKLG